MAAALRQSEVCVGVRRAEMAEAVAGYPEVAAAFTELARTKQNYDRKMSED